MRKILQVVVAGVLASGLMACSDTLNVDNPNNPDEPRALNRPTDVENLIIGSYNTFHVNSYLFGGVAPQLECLGLENYSNLNNSAMGARSTIPRPPVTNNRNDNGTVESYAPWIGWHRAARAAALGLSRVKLPTFTFFPASASQNARAKAFANFVIGVSLGSVAMVYDSGSVISDQDDMSSNAPLTQVTYDSLARYALARLDSAVAYARTMGTMGIPAAWMATTDTLSRTTFVGLIYGWKARIAAGIARTPTDANVNWTVVRAAADSFLADWKSTNPVGSAGDVVMKMNPAQSWSNGNMSQLYYNGSVNWHMMHGFIVGMADTLGQYTSWLANGMPAAYQIVTGDLRFPQGGATCNTGPTTSACRIAQQGSAGKYFENRPSGNDWSGEVFANSNYRLGRLLAWYNAGNVGNMVTMARSEIRLLAAEARYLSGDYAGAAALVDSSRVNIAGLPSLVTAGVTNNTAQIPGTSCVPRVPVPSGSTWTTACGTLWEALKYEKRMETAYTWIGTWYFDNRRWGDLPAGTALFFPVPYQESDARGTSNFYGTGGSGATAAPKGNYGL